MVIELSWPPDAPGLVDVYVRVRLNAGLFRLRYPVGEIRASGFTLLSQAQLADFFDHCCLWFGRTSTERINDDFKRLIDHYQSQGYVGVRLTKREVHPDPLRKRVDLDLAIEERRRIVLHFPGSRRINNDDLRGAVTIFRDNYASANELDESARNIFRLYQQRGFFGHGSTGAGAIAPAIRCTSSFRSTRDLSSRSASWSSSLTMRAIR